MGNKTFMVTNYSRGFNMKEWNEYKNIISEIEDFQKKMIKKHSAGKKRLLSLGGQANSSPYTDKPSMKRSKSAPPGAGGV